MNTFTFRGSVVQNDLFISNASKSQFRWPIKALNTAAAVTEKQNNNNSEGCNDLDFLHKDVCDWFWIAHNPSALHRYLLIGYLFPELGVCW